jgi:hypothetical protein
MIGKPNWNGVNLPKWHQDYYQVPDWANWLAQNEKGYWCFYQQMPQIYGLESKKSCGDWWMVGYEKHEREYLCIGKSDPKNWKESLEKRP